MLSKKRKLSHDNSMKTRKTIEMVKEEHTKKKKEGEKKIGEEKKERQQVG